VIRRCGRSPAILVAVLALVAGIGGTAVAGPDVSSSAISKKKVKRIARKQAVKQINALAPGLSVAHAGTASSAERADSADRAGSANPIAYALVNRNGGVDEARSKRVTDANVTHESGTLGVYCIRNLGFNFKGVQLTLIDNFLPDAPADIAKFNSGSCGSGAGQGSVRTEVVTGDGLLPANGSFYIVFYN
jgi:hypothetical protein